MSSKGSLNNRFKGFGAKPSSDAWQNIVSELPQKRKKKMIIWWIVSGTGVAASLFIAVSFFTTRRINEKEKFAEQKKLIDSSVESNKKLTADDTYLTDKSGNSKINGLKVDLDTPIFEKKGIKNQKKKTVRSQKKLLVPTIDQSNDLIANSTLQSKTDTFSLVPRLKNPIIILKTSHISLMSPRETKLLQVRRNDLRLTKIEVNKNKQSRWELGGKLGSDLAMNTRQLTPSVSTETASQDPIALDNPGTIYNVGGGNNNGGGNNGGGNNNPPIVDIKVNRLVSGSFLLRFYATPRLFIEAAPTFTMLVLKQTYNDSLPETTKTPFYSVGSGLNIGYKIINRKRWALDFSVGASFEKVLTDQSNIAKGIPVNLFGNSAQIGFNYQISDKVNLRLAPKFSLIYRNNEKEFSQLFKGYRNLGVGVSLLKNI